MSRRRKPRLTDPAAFTAEVLARTSGKPCDACEARLPDLIDGTLGATDRTLVQRHVSRCPSCRAVALALDDLRSRLPRMAAVPPGPALATRVLAATTGRRRLAPNRAGVAAVWRLLLRPRFALEAAYVGAMILWLVVSIPGSPLQEAPARALALTQEPPTELAALDRPLRAAGAVAWDRARAGWSGLRSLGEGVSLRFTRSAVARDDLALHARALGAAALRFDASTLRVAGDDVLSDLDQLWQSWVEDGAADSPAASRSDTTRPPDGERETR